jgi:hypothetical protein
MILHPWTDAELGFAVAGRRIDVVDPILQHQTQNTVSYLLRDPTQRRTPEYDRRATVTRPTKRLPLNHPNHTIIDGKQNNDFASFGTARAWIQHTQAIL